MQQKMHKEDIKDSVGRLIFVGLAVLAQVGWFVLTIMKLTENYAAVSAVARLISAFCVLTIFGKHIMPDVKLSWIILIFMFPLFGMILYLLSTRSNFVHTMHDRLKVIDSDLAPLYPENKEIYEKLKKEDPWIAHHAYFLKHESGFPVYDGTKVSYYKDASDGLTAQLEDLRKAEHFIFMEYHAIQDKQSFQELKDVLHERAEAGVEVRLFYDDIGSIGFINTKFIREMKELGIQCRVFNPIVPIVNVFMNNRDHRKITVIDGKVGFTGGYNLADEYFNITHPFGHWKDTGIRLEGPAVKTLTLLFLEMWNAMKKSETEDYKKYMVDVAPAPDATGYVIPFGDSPLDEIHTAKDVYQNILKNANTQAWIITPYLILTDDFSRELQLAARRGIDVRIITPGIPDKKLIYQMTRSYYAALASAGVRIYEYTPGFCHAKMLLSDKTAVVGTANFDYRSFFHHFENAVYLYDCDCIAEIRKDFEATFPQCREVTEQYSTGRSTSLRIWQCILRFFAPLA